MLYKCNYTNTSNFNLRHIKHIKYLNIYASRYLFQVFSSVAFPQFFWVYIYLSLLFVLLCFGGVCFGSRAHYCAYLSSWITSRGGGGLLSVGADEPWGHGWVVVGV